MRASKEKSREKILTQAHPAKIAKNTDAVVLKQASLFLVASEDGNVPFDLPHGFGLFFKDCRYLNGYELTLNGAPLVVLSGSGERGYETHHYLSNPGFGSGKGAIERNTIEVNRERIVRAGAIHERLVITNRALRRIEVRLTLQFRASFEDLFVVKGFVRPSRGTLHKPTVMGKGRVELGYTGKDGVVRTTTIMFHPAPTHLEGKRATFELKLAPRDAQELAIWIRPAAQTRAAPSPQTGHPGTPAGALHRWADRAESIWLERSTKVHSDNPLFDRVYRRALLDLHLLRSRLDGEDYFAAGVPWYVTLFGRDSITVSLQTLAYGTAMAKSTLRLLARYQATAVDRYRDAEPGKVLHEFRCGELSNLGAIPQSPAYYGTVDATMLFLILTAEYVRWSGDLDLAEQLRPHLDAALGWMEQALDSDGYFSYRGRYQHGLVNQGWKDSGNAIVNADGSLAEPPISLCEVQGYAYRAWRQSALLLRDLGDPGAGRKLDQQADALRSRFARDFWDDDLGGYILARQRGGRPAAVMASNTGQVLWGGLATAAHARRIAARLMEPDMFSGWGIRTLSAKAKAYNPMAYHLGSVWPHDNSLILAGLRRYGHDGPALRIFDALFDAATHLRDYRLPELYCGYARGELQRPVGYPVACSPQAWAAGSLPYALWNLLGLWPDSRRGVLQVRRPRLPAWLSELQIEGLPVGTARVDLHFGLAAPHRSKPVDVQVSVRTGDLRVELDDTVTDPHAFE
jgi:glycogen debranching enzyme